ncbi:MarR family transcriptional regulator [Embleya scabrispora]|uniref:MarR family transcriptional regulator n=1 Tax=Embleya scabrispora TaxID=159449 RepID=A0A1T3NQB6_9ACTN|nr:MarR family transcriptional regulator [Embleya scabrispora]OPC78958.1 MarR family transcriptional regulator [Embleya scabrispora]
MNDDDRLTTSEHEIWRSYFTGTRELAAHLDRRMRREAGMPMTYFEILGLLAESPDRRMRMSELAAASLSSSSRLSHAVTAMEKSGWVSRGPAEGDRRGWVAHLTDAGLTALAEAEPTHAATVREHVFDALTPLQVASMAEIGRSIRDGLSGVCASARAEAAGTDVSEAGAGTGAGAGVEVGVEMEEIDTGMDCPLDGSE